MTAAGKQRRGVSRGRERPPIQLPRIIPRIDTQRLAYLKANVTAVNAFIPPLSGSFLSWDAPRQPQAPSGAPPHPAAPPCTAPPRSLPQRCSRPGGNGRWPMPRARFAASSSSRSNLPEIIVGLHSNLGDTSLWVCDPHVSTLVTLPRAEWGSIRKTEVSWRAARWECAMARWPTMTLSAETAFRCTPLLAEHPAA